jgi:hypothetical protein
MGHPVHPRACSQQREPVLIGADEGSKEGNAQTNLALGLL